MAKKSMIQRELKRQRLVNKYKETRSSLRTQIRKSQTLDEIFDLQRRLQRLPANSSVVRLRNRCWKTGRSRGFYRDLGLSRHVLREMAHSCLLPGIIKASW